MPTFKDLTPPPGGETISIQGGKLTVPDRPVIPFIEGDGTGPDIWRASVRVFDAAVQKGLRGGKRRSRGWRSWRGQKSFDSFNNWLPDDTVAAFSTTSSASRGPLTTPSAAASARSTCALRQMLDLYVCLRPVRYFTGVPSPVKTPEKVDMVIFRRTRRTSTPASRYAAARRGSRRSGLPPAELPEGVQEGPLRARPRPPGLQQHSSIGAPPA
jgi:isocitrate dehydrogenase